MASLFAHGIWLPLVLGHASVDGSVFPSASIIRSVEDGVAYWTISGRIGALKTLGRGIVFLVAAPSAPIMPTVGRLVMFAAI